MYEGRRICKCNLIGQSVAEISKKPVDAAGAPPVRLTAVNPSKTEERTAEPPAPLVRPVTPAAEPAEAAAPKPKAEAPKAEPPKADAKPAEAPKPKTEAKPADKPRDGDRKAEPPKSEAKPADKPKSDEKPKTDDKPKTEAKPADKPKTEAKPDPEPKLAPPIPQAGPARLERRHIVLGASFLAMVVLPIVVTTAYLFGWAQDQYASRVGFVLRNEEMASASSMLSGLLGVTGGPTSSDNEVLYRFIQSEDMAARVDKRLNLHGIYSTHASTDPVFSLAPESSREELLAYWNRMMKVFYDNGSGLIEVRVNAFTPEESQAIARVILEESTSLVNAISDIAREDATRYAREDLSLAEDRLRETRMAVAEFRNRTQMVDPAADVAGQMTLLGSLQGQLATALIESDVLKQTGVKSEDSRSVQVARRISVIEERLREERAKLGAGSTGTQTGDFVTAVGDFERLRVEQEFAEKAYLASLAAYDAARAEAQRKSRYLATYIQPTLAETALYPRRLLIISMTFVFLTLAWSVVALIYYAIRDRR